MAARVVKEFSGFSGSKIYLMNKHGNLFVRKQGNLARNIERTLALEKANYPIAKILGISGNTVDIEYVHGLDIRSYLVSHGADKLLDFLIDILDKFAESSVDKDYTGVIQNFLDQVDFTDLPFTRQELEQRLPAVTIYPQSEYHGDLTLENIIYSESSGFVLIDAQSGVWDSYVFDVLKLRQDLECHWFMRFHPAILESKLSFLQSKLLKRYRLAQSKYILIVMLLRVYRNAAPGTFEYNFLLREITRLWK
jgi:hypothetical protein